ncbi:Glycoside hydrolase, family 5 [Kalmanozyma brasiliensis GHG001]|uniref:Glycoside hydrolase family 5 C-terminal domain-containing protein n=1 Tax=Kalmanozyma brasiliensis (strain GHG001) TaxID=1365824 RepID=V5GQ52_KALBG|nr:Glycoside hydrolase, family 5 [Kalmanozyma brasiliensis GHG001]EST08057.1 Glycoside hydrolase, family 5 [Kalmanozyma brasiliensis GHG001]
METKYAATDLSDAALGPSGLRIENGRFVDSLGRTINLHGVNIAGSSKLPTSPNGLSHLHEEFYETHRTVSFVGRPFPLEEAPLHFARLRAWGLPLIRLLVTWESISHKGPGKDDVDTDYVDYLEKLVTCMAEYGLKCFVCVHQDVWSRFSGGSGAPGWTFEVAGLDIEAFTETGAAYIHCVDEKQKREATPGKKREESGAFLWPSGYQKLAPATMATLFWAGDALAPKTTIKDGDKQVGLQTFLQNSYIEAFGALADRLLPLEACLGFEPMNEPHRGLINLHDFHAWNYDTDLHIGHYPSLIQALALGSGYKQNVKFYVKSWPFPTRVSHRATIDPKGKSCWLPSSRTSNGVSNADKDQGMCIWRAHGVWEWDESKQVPVVLQYDYFEKDHRQGREGQRIEWYRDCFAPFLKRFSDRVNRSKAFTFVEPVPNEFVPPWIPARVIEDPNLAAEYKQAAYNQKYATKTLIDTPRPGGEARFVYAPHFYDLNVVFSRAHAWMSVNVQGLSRGMFLPKALYFGVQGLRKNYLVQMSKIKELALASLGSVPIIIGEVGLPFDINARTAYRTGDYTKQSQLLDALINAMEQLGLGFTLWNYNPANRVAYGDGWNFEDFSFTNGDLPDHPTLRSDFRNASHEDDELYRGGRCLESIIRPYAVKVAGEQVYTSFDVESLFFEVQWKNSSTTSTVTEIFLPGYHYKNRRFSITTSDCETRFDAELQTLYVEHKDTRAGVVHKLKIELEDAHGHKLERLRERRKLVKPEGMVERVGSWMPESVVLAWEGLTLEQVVSLTVIAAVLVGMLMLADYHVRMFAALGEDDEEL